MTLTANTWDAAENFKQSIIILYSYPSEFTFIAIIIILKLSDLYALRLAKDERVFDITFRPYLTKLVNPILRYPQPTSTLPLPSSSTPSLHTFAVLLVMFPECNVLHVQGVELGQEPPVLLPVWSHAGWHLLTCLERETDEGEIS